MTDKISPANKAAKADDRNLVASAESQAGPSLEDQLFTFWQKNRHLVLGAIVLVLVVIVGREIWGYLQASKEAEIREAYGQAVSSEQRLAFAREHEGHPLAGAALLSVADESYANREFARATEQYADAAAALDRPLLVARARLGQGMAGLQGDNPNAGVAILEGLADDPSAPETLRYETLFHLAAHAHASGDDTKARSALDKLDAMNPVGVWASRAVALRAQLPVDDEAATVKLPGS